MYVFSEDTLWCTYKEPCMSKAFNIWHICKGLKPERSSFACSVKFRTSLPVSVRRAFTVHHTCAGMLLLVVAIIVGYQKPSCICRAAAMVPDHVERSPAACLNIEGQYRFSIQVSPGWVSKAIFGKPAAAAGISGVEHDGKYFRSGIISVQCHSRLKPKRVNFSGTCFPFKAVVQYFSLGTIW